eukprot:650410-Pelagomonas_calceolata.AAC.1
MGMQQPFLNNTLHKKLTVQEGSVAFFTSTVEHPKNGDASTTNSPKPWLTKTERIQKYPKTGNETNRPKSTAHQNQRFLCSFLRPAAGSQASSRGALPVASTGSSESHNTFHLLKMGGGCESIVASKHRRL